MWLTSGKCCQKKLIMIIVQKLPRPAHPAWWWPAKRASMLLAGPPKTALLIYNNYLEDESIFLPRNEHDFFTAASTTSWGITKLRRELCQNALLPINKSKLSALFIIFFWGGTEHKTTRMAALFQIHTMNVYNFCLSFFNYGYTKLSDFCKLNEIPCERLCSCKEPKRNAWFFKN